MIIIVNEVKDNPITKYYVNGEGLKELTIGNIISRREIAQSIEKVRIIWINRKDKPASAIGGFQIKIISKNEQEEIDFLDRDMLTSIIVYACLFLCILIMYAIKITKQKKDK